MNAYEVKILLLPIKSAVKINCPVIQSIRVEFCNQLNK